MTRIYMTHCCAKKDDSLRHTGRRVTPDRLYAATPTQRFMDRCKEKQVLEGLRLELLSDLADSRLDKGRALHDLRLGLTKDNIDRLVVAICAIFREVMRRTGDT